MKIFNFQAAKPLRYKNKGQKVGLLQEPAVSDDFENKSPSTFLLRMKFDSYESMY